MIDLDQHGDTLELQFRQPARNRALWITGIVVFALFGLIGFGRIFPPGTTGFLVVCGVIGLGAAIAIVIVLQVPTVTGVTSTFDIPARRITVLTNQEGRETREAFTFDAVRELGLLSQTYDGSRLETVNLILSDGRTVFLGQDRQSREYSLKPFTETVAASIETIRTATGLPAPPDQPLPLLGEVIGVTRT